MRDFIKQTGQDRDYFREQNYPKSHNSKKAVDNSESYGIIGSNNKFVPAEDVTKAEEYARDVLGIKNVSYKGLDTFTANEFNKVLEEHFKEFPELKKQINFVGTCQERNRLLEIEVRKYYENECLDFRGILLDKDLNSYINFSTKKYMKNFQIKENVYAQSCSKTGIIDFSEFHGISINENLGKNHKEFIDSINNDVKSGHLPVGCDTIKSIIDHEIGHQLDNLLDLKYNRLISLVFKEFENNPSEMKEKLSGYALQGFLETKDNFNRYSEPIAEAWSEYRNNPEPREIAKKIGQIIERRYNEKFKEGSE